jgi:hypothetical protein
LVPGWTGYESGSRIFQDERARSITLERAISSDFAALFGIENDAICERILWETVLGPTIDDNIVSSNRQDRIPQLVNTRKAAEILGRSPATLKRWRYEGIGPDYVEMEGRVSYDVAVLLEYIRQNTRASSVRAAMEETRGAL